MHPDHPAISPLHSIFDSARHFGLSEQQVWRTVDDSFREVGDDTTVLEYLDDLAAALAHDVLSVARREEQDLPPTGRRWVRIRR